MMRLLSSHISSAVLGAIAMVLLVLLGLDVIGAIVDGLGDMKNEFTFGEMLFYVLLTLPTRIYETIPIASLIGCLVGLGALANNSELVVMRSAGVSVLRITWFVIKPVLWLILAGVLLGEFVVPYTDQLAESRKSLLKGGQTAQEAAGGIWNREGNEFMHFNAVYPGGVLFGVTRYRFDENRKLTESSFSERASFQDGFWLEENGVSTAFLSDQTQTDSFVVRRWETELSPDLLRLVVMPPRSLDMRSLREYIGYLQEQDRDSAAYQLAFWSKAMQPLTIASLVLVAVSFIFGPLRSVTMGYRVFAGVIVGVIFRTGQDLLGPAAIVFGFNPVLSIVVPALILAGVGFYLLHKTR